MSGRVSREDGAILLRDTGTLVGEAHGGTAIKDGDHRLGKTGVDEVLCHLAYYCIG